MPVGGVVGSEAVVVSDPNPTNDVYDVATEAGLVACYDETVREVFRSATRLTRGDLAASEDLVQETFLRLTRAARRGDASTVGIGWMITTMRRRHFDLLRTAEREQRRLRLVSGTDTHHDRPLAPTQVREVLSGLSAREQSALILRYLEDLPVSEVAEAMNATVRATESLLQRSKRKARKEASA